MNNAEMDFGCKKMSSLDNPIWCNVSMCHSSFDVPVGEKADRKSMSHEKVSSTLLLIQNLTNPLQKRESNMLMSVQAE